MPPVIAILLALLTKEVYLSLFAGCALGALLVEIGRASCRERV